MNKTITNVSVAHTIGNVTALFTEFIKEWFPKNYFKHTHINTRMAYREQKREENSDYEFIKKNRPILVIRPRLDADNQDIFLTYSLFTTNMFDMRFTGQTTNFMPFFNDRDKQISLSFLMSRIRVIFDVTIMVDTEMEQINQYFYLLSRVVPDRIYRMNTSLECMIPQSNIELISAYSGVPIKDNDTGTTKEFLRYMMSHANRYVTFKERPSTSSMDFFMYYPLAIDWVVTDISRDEPSKKSWAVYTSNINFTLTTEFNTPAIYEFFTTRKQPKELGYKFDIGSDHYKDRANGINIIPYFTVPNLFAETRLDNGFELLYTQAFETDVEKEGKDDVLDIKPIFQNTNAMDIITWHNTAGISNNVFLKFIVMCDNEQLVQGEGFDVDYDTFSLIIHNAKSDATYRLSVFLNNLYAQDLMENYNELTSSNEPPVGRVTDKTIITKKDSEVGIK
jgi:hypothetical protein